MKFSHLKRLYLNQPLVLSNELSLDSENVHYVQKVLRMRNNDWIRVFNSNDGEFLAKVTSLNSKSSIKLLLLERLRTVIPSLQVTLGLAIIKADAMQAAVQTAVQLGVSSIMPISAARSQYHAVNADRLTKSITEATRQSERLKVANLLVVKSLDDCQNYFADYSLVVYANENENETQNLLAIRDILQTAIVETKAEQEKSILLIVGPEGGFTDQELELMKQAKGISVSLGSNVLKTETAVAALLAQFNLLVYTQIEFQKLA